MNSYAFMIDDYAKYHWRLFSRPHCQHNVEGYKNSRITQLNGSNWLRRIFDDWIREWTEEISF
jgi:hypothetical protein